MTRGRESSCLITHVGLADSGLGLQNNVHHCRRKSGETTPRKGIREEARPDHPLPTGSTIRSCICTSNRPDDCRTIHENLKAIHENLKAIHENPKNSLVHVAIVLAIMSTISKSTVRCPKLSKLEKKLSFSHTDRPQLPKSQINITCLPTWPRSFITS